MAQGTPRGKGLMRDSLFAAGRKQLEDYIGRAVTSLTAEAAEPEPSRPSVAPVTFRSV
jgi:hypothetical protein